MADTTPIAPVVPEASPEARRAKTRYARLPVGYCERLTVSRGQGADILLVRLALSTARRTLPGVLRVGPGWLLDEIGWPEATLRRCLRELEDAGLITFDRSARVLHIHGMIEADPPRSLSSIVAIARDLHELPACSARDGIRAECDRAMAGHSLLAEWQKMIGDDDPRIQAENREREPRDSGHSELHGDGHSEPHSELHGDGHSTHACTRARPVPLPVPIPSPSPSPDALARFDRFWSVYPLKVAKAAAWKAWQKLNPSDELLERILATLALQRRSSQWTKDGGKYVPHPSTYLNQGRYEDEVQVEDASGDPVYDKWDECRVCGDVHKVGECPQWLCRDCRQHHNPDQLCYPRRSREFHEQEARDIEALAAAEGLTIEQAREAYHARRMAILREGLRGAAS